MVKHRASYWKTTVIALGVALVCAALSAWVALSPLPRAAASLIALVPALGLLLALVIVAGGLVCLWRDAREAAGKPDPLARLAIDEPRQSPLRFLFGARLRPGDLVRVRSLEEIGATLDKKRTLGGLPFMPEMEPYSGRVFRVHRRVDHVNDMRNKTGLRRMRDAVTLTGVRCSGAAHEGCEAECQILWKDEWLARVAPNEIIAAGLVARALPADFKQAASDQAHFCQMTALWEASSPMPKAAVRRNLRTLFSGNFRLVDCLVAMLSAAFNAVQAARKGAGYPYMPAETASGRTPTANSQLQTGHVVRVRSKQEIAATLVGGKNRGLWFDRDMVRFCGQPAVVRRRVTRLIHEATGKMVVMKTPCVALEDVVATGEFLDLCPQHELIYWREVWLEDGRENSSPAVST